MSLAAAGPSSALWYLTRGTGAVTLVLLTATRASSGIADVAALAPRRAAPRFVVDGAAPERSRCWPWCSLAVARPHRACSTPSRRSR